MPEGKSPIIFDATAKASLSDYIQNSNLVQPSLGLGGPLEYKSGSQYDSGILPGMNQEDYRAINQTGWDQYANGMTALLPLVATKFAQGMQGLAALGVGAVGSSFGGPSAFDFMENNPFSLFLDDVESYIKKNLPIYHREGYDQMSFSQRLSKPDFWSDEFVDGMAFSLSAWIPSIAGASLISKSANFAKGFTKAGKILGGVPTASAAADATALSALTQGTKFGNYLIRNANQLSQGTKALTAAFFNRSIESTFESGEVYKQVKEGSLKNLMDAGVPREEAERISQQNASKAASGTFLLNYLAMPAEIFQAGLLFKGIKQSASVGKLLTEALKSPNTYKATAAKIFSKSVAGDFAKGFVKNALMEGPYEENLQLAIQNYEKNRFLRGSEDDVVSSLFSGMLKNFTTIEGGVSIGLGAIQGGAMGGGFEAYGNRQERKSAASLAGLIQSSFNDLNSSIISNTVKNLYKKDPDTGKVLINPADGSPIINEEALEAFKKEMSTLTDLEKSKNIAAITGDRTKYDLYKKMQITHIALSYFSVGAKNDLIEKLGEYSKMTPEDIESLGISFLEEDSNGNPLSPQQIAAKYSSFVERISTLYNTIQNRYPDLESNEIDNQAHKGMIFLSGVNQLILGDSLKENRVKTETLRLSQLTDISGQLNNNNDINNLIDQYEVIEDFIEENKDSGRLSDTYEKELRNRQKNIKERLKLLKEIEGLDKSELHILKRSKAQQDINANITRPEYFISLDDGLVTENEIYNSAERYENYTDPKKWAVFKVKLAEEAKRQEEKIIAEANDKTKEILDSKPELKDLDKVNDPNRLTALLKEVQDLITDTNTDLINETVAKIHNRLDKLAEEEKKKKDAEEALKAQAEALRLQKEEEAKKEEEERKRKEEEAKKKAKGSKKEKKPKEKKEPKPRKKKVASGTATIIPEAINPNPISAPSDKDLSTVLPSTKVPQKQRSVLTLFFYNGRDPNSGYPKREEDFTKDPNTGDITILPSKEDTDTQQPFLNGEIKIGDIASLEAEPNNPAVKGKVINALNLPVRVVFGDGAFPTGTAYLGTYKVSKEGVEYLNDFHYLLINKKDKTVRELEDLEFFDNTLKNIKSIRDTIWADYSSGKLLTTEVQISSISNGQIVNQKDNLRGQPIQTGMRSRPITQVYENPSDYELVVYTNMFGGGFTSDGETIVPRIEIRSESDYTKGISYLMVRGPAYNPDGPFDNRVPLRLLNARLNELEFHEEAIKVIHDRLKYFKGNNINQNEVKKIVEDLNQFIYVEGKSEGKEVPEISNFLIDYMNSGPNGTVQPRISMKVNDEAYIVFYMRTQEGDSNPDQEKLFTGMKFFSQDKEFTAADFVEKYPEYSKIGADDVFKKLLGNRFFNVNIKEFSNTNFSFKLLPKIDFKNYKQSLIQKGAVLTDVARITFPDGEVLPAFYNPEIQIQPIQRITTQVQAEELGIQPKQPKSTKKDLKSETEATEKSKNSKLKDKKAELKEKLKQNKKDKPCK